MNKNLCFLCKIFYAFDLLILIKLTKVVRIPKFINVFLIFKSQTTFPSFCPNKCSSQVVFTQYLSVVLFWIWSVITKANFCFKVSVAAKFLPLNCYSGYFLKIPKLLLIATFYYKVPLKRETHKRILIYFLIIFKKNYYLQPKITVLLGDMLKNSPKIYKQKFKSIFFTLTGNWWFRVALDELVGSVLKKF